MLAEDLDGRLDGHCLRCDNKPRDKRRQAHVYDTGLCPRCDDQHRRVERKRTRREEKVE